MRYAGYQFSRRVRRGARRHGLAAITPPAPTRRSESRTAGLSDTSFAFWRLSGIVRAYSNSPQMSGQCFRWSSSSLPTMSAGYFPVGKSAADTTAMVPFAIRSVLCFYSLRCVQ